MMVDETPQGAHGPDDKQQLLKLSEVSIWLDSYDDVFSDFDPRPYSQRVLSDDFIAMARKVILAKKTGAFELHFLIPAGVRNDEDERLIRKRISGHFAHQHRSVIEDIRRQRREGLILTLASVAVLFGAASLPTLAMPEYLRNLLTVVLTPGGWFMVFNGLDSIFYKPRLKKSEAEFCKRLSRCRIAFTEY